MNYRTALVRNILVSGTNGAITLAILLIAPLGLASVIMNTALVTVATFFTGQTADQVIRFLQNDASPSSTHPVSSIQVLPDDPGQIQRR